MDDKIKPVRELVIASIKEEFTTSDNFIIPKPLDQQLRTLMSMTSDINFSIKAIDELIEFTNKSADDATIKTALWKSCVVTYAKCFSDGTKSGHFNLDRNEVFKLKPDLEKIHGEVLVVRNDFISHRGDNEYEHIIVFYSQTKREVVGPKIGQFNMKSLRANNLTVDELQDYKSLFLHVMKFIEERRLRQSDRLYKRLISEYTNEMIKWQI